MIQVTLNPMQDLKIVASPDGAYEGGLIIDGADTRTLPTGDPDVTNPLAVGVIYVGGTQTFTVKLDNDVNPANANFISETIEISPAAAQSLGLNLSGIPK